MKRVLVLLLAVALTAAACGGHKSSSGSKGKSVTISNEQGTTWTCGSTRSTRTSTSSRRGPSTSSSRS